MSVTCFDRLPYELTHRIKLTACLSEFTEKYDGIIHMIRFSTCMKELREDSEEDYNEVTVAARSLWRVIQTRLLDGLNDAHDNNMQAWNMLMYMRSKLGLANGCGPQLGEYRSIMDYLDNVVLGRVTMTRRGLILSGINGQSDAADFIRVAEVANEFYVGAPWHIIDAGYTSDEEDDIEPDLKTTATKTTKTDEEIYQFLHIRRVGFHI